MVNGWNARLIMSCSAYLRENGLYGHCRNGFPQITGICGSDNSKGIPVCMNEKLCGRLYPETGKPPEYRLNLIKQTQTKAE